VAGLVGLCDPELDSVELAAVAQDELFGPIGEELSRYRSALADFKAVRDG